MFCILSFWRDNFSSIRRKKNTSWGKAWLFWESVNHVSSISLHLHKCKVRKVIHLQQMANASTYAVNVIKLIVMCLVFLYRQFLSNWGIIHEHMKLDRLLGSSGLWKKKVLSQCFTKMRLQKSKQSLIKY